MSDLPEAGGGAAAGTVPAEDRFRAFYDRTAQVAYSLAFRVCADEGRASRACEAAYVSAWDESRGSEPLRPGRLFELVRQCALREGPAPPTTGGPDLPYTSAEGIQASLAAIPAESRRALELAYFGGLPLAETAAILGRSEQELRVSMRSALLQLGARPAAAEERA